MTKLFSIGVIVLLASVAAAQQAPVPKPPDQQVPPGTDMVMPLVVVEAPPGAVPAAGGRLIINAAFDPAMTIVAGNGAVRKGNVVTITTTAAHGLSCQSTVTISGVSDPSFNGTFQIGMALPSQTSFTYNQNGPDATSGGGTVTVNGSATAAERAVIQQAINEWQNIVQDSGATTNPYSVTFRFTALPSPNTLGCTRDFATQAGNLVAANISFNTSVTFWENPTNPPPNNLVDLLSVVRHELGHAVGWYPTNRVNTLVVGNSFNPPRLNIPLADFGTSNCCHTDPAWMPNDVMVPSIGTGVRRSISPYPAASLVARAYAYVIRMQFVDATSTGTQDGSAVNPWQTVPTACTSSPAGMPLLLANMTFHVAVPFRFCGNASTHVVNAARGGAIVGP